MTPTDFDRVISDRCNKIEQVLRTKAAEYSSNTDRLHNFKRGAVMFNCSPEQHNLFLNSKHLISIIDMVNDIANGKVASYDKWDEKIGDAVNYLILLEGLVLDRLKSK